MYSGRQVRNLITTTVQISKFKKFVTGAQRLGTYKAPDAWTYMKAYIAAKYLVLFLH